MMARLRALGAEGRRRVIQVLAAVLYNANVGDFLKGAIYRGNSKKFCVPGLNCYSCPGAIASCPLGALQASLNNVPTAVPLYLLGILLLFGALLGRAVCAFLCPFGLIQELLYKIPTKKLKKSAWTRRLTVIKYIVLVVMVIALPLYFLIVNGVVTPAFCKWLCPVGTLEGGVPLLIANEGLRAQNHAAHADGDLNDIAVAALLGNADLGLDVVLEVALELGELFLHARLEAIGDFHALADIYKFHPALSFVGYWTVFFPSEC